MKALILAKSGFGKSTSIGEIPELGLKGLDPKTTYIISCVNKPLPFRGANSKFKMVTLSAAVEQGFAAKTALTNVSFRNAIAADLAKGNRIVTNDATQVAAIIEILADSNTPFTNIVLDDMNYISQDFYMKNALKGGWDRMCVPA